MHPRIEEVLNYLDTERSALREAVELVPAAARNQSPGADRWSVAQVLQHLAGVENRVGMGRAGTLAGNSPRRDCRWRWSRPGRSHPAAPGAGSDQSLSMGSVRRQ